MNQRNFQTALALVTTMLLSSWCAADCTYISTGLIPLNELGSASYQGSAGGLYPGGSNTRPAAHLTSGTAIASTDVLPRDSSGNPDTLAGRIVLISIGMSNTTQEFGSGGSWSFKPRSDADLSRAPLVRIVDGAQGGQTAAVWANSNANCWNVLSSRLVAAGVTTGQVQLAWIKMADAQPAQYGVFPAHAQLLKSEYAQVIRLARAKYPNIKIAYLSSRTRAWRNDSTALNPEPYAYESNFAVKWVIDDQINGIGNLNYDAAAGAVVAPWLSWGPYLWADGTNPRSDGLTWLCSDTTSDFTHPSASGQAKVANQLMAWFHCDTTARPWYLKTTSSGAQPLVNVTPSTSAGAAPLSVSFNTSASDSDGTIASTWWSFDDGGTTTTLSPTKVFKVPGSYNVSVTVVDNSGNHASQTIPITVTPPAGVRDWYGYH